MDFGVEKFITPFIESQFPDFYKKEGPNFILFVKAYYEWMQQDGSPIGETRRLFNYRDIDNTPSNTVEDFLFHFQQKYLYGIPYKIIADKRLLLKHIFDVYRSKGNFQCYKLLFRLVYNEDMDLYIPGYDLLKPSDGTWVQPKYLEVTNSDILPLFVGKQIIGLSSKTTAVVEDYIREPFNKNIFSTIYLSNILPKGASFSIGEKLILADDSLTEAQIQSSSKVIGSLDTLEITNGGQNFKVGDILKIAHTDSFGNKISNGTDGLLKITSLQKFFGSLGFSINDGGFGYSLNAFSFVYPFSNSSFSDAPTANASFQTGYISYATPIEYNTDLIIDYYQLPLNSSSFNFPNNPIANLTNSTLQQDLNYNTDYFGSLSSLNNVLGGNNYTQPAYTNVYTAVFSKPLTGTISYSNTSNTVTGVGTNFTNVFTSEILISLTSNPGFSFTREVIPIANVVNDTTIILHGPPKYSSTSTSLYAVGYPTLKSQLSNQEAYNIYHKNANVSNIFQSWNAQISANPSSGNNIIKTVTAINSGKGYVEGESVNLYLSGGVSTLRIAAGGKNYTNNDLLVFTSVQTSRIANGYVTTDSNGTVTHTFLSSSGSGYEDVPNVSVYSNTGTGAIITCTALSEYDTTIEVQGKVRKTGNGRGKSHWYTTRGFLNSDKYIQDSHYYQDLSYQINVPVTLDKYKEVLYNTFHIAGTELFSKFQKISSEYEVNEIVYETSPIFGLSDESDRELMDEFDNLLEEELSLISSPEITLVTSETQILITDESGNIIQQEVL